jgi:hypothetical protein
MSQTPSAWHSEYRSNEPAAKFNPTPEEQHAYNQDFHQILNKLVANPFFVNTDSNGRVAEGKRFPMLDATDPSLTPEQKEYIAGPHTKIGPGNAWSRSPSLARVCWFRLGRVGEKS